MMNKTDAVAIAKAAMLTLAGIKATVEAFDQGETNVFDALDSIAATVDAYHAAMHRQEAA